MIARCLILRVLFTLVLASSSMAAQGSADKWTDKEMGKGENDPKGLTLRLRLQPQSLPIPAGSRCRNVDAPDCMFQFTYFLGKGFDPTKKQRLNILFIPGGPGAIVDTSNSSVALKMLERQHNVVYFHPRGMGQSAIDGDKEFDQFLRADYVVEDIEKLRVEILKTRPWDAIYAHSWGTTIAQRYAARFGKPKDPSPKVMSLVLSGPVDRHRENTQGARNQMIVENLRMIFDYYRSQGAANCQCESTAFLKKLVMDISAPQVPALGNQLRPQDNFCFLKTDVADEILKQLANRIAEIDENYGSADLIVDHFETLEKDRDFQKRFGKLPIDFFAAVRFLQMSGAPVKDG
ncbi:MAG TPA: alpha/beta hydrolase, partial [Candidatus Binatia bacterium]|nr:alpha/beta hydrolase [Candidatus Binatia bacterium]